MAYGKDIASKVPAPDKLVGMSSGGDPPAEDDPADVDEDKTVAAGMMKDVMSAMKGSDPEAACEALDAYLESVGFVKK